ncbi:MAG: D-alanyl-D-alanine carboxypeptidase [Xanthomonadaceae bacterium]|nr:D-alanyl-D-alanine carboxypeptidase [Xanthomonadaceae bacterium]
MLFVISAMIAFTHAETVDSATYAKTVYQVGVRLGAKINEPDIFETDSESDFVPASVTKMMTLATTLEKLGAQYKFETIMSWSQVEGEANSV